MLKQEQENKKKQQNIYHEISLSFNALPPTFLLAKEPP